MVKFKELKIELKSKYPYVDHVLFTYFDEDILSNDEVSDIYEYFENLNKGR